MEKRAICTSEAPPAIGPYSQAISANGFIFISGQLPLDRAGNIVPGDIKVQTIQCLENIKAILKAAGAGMEDLVKITVFVTDLRYFKEINEVYGSYFNSPPPARSFVQISALPRDARIELEGIAMK